MKKLFNIGRDRHERILSPLGGGGASQRLRNGIDRLPVAAAPVAVTLVGGLGLVIALAAILGGGQAENAQTDDARPAVALSEQSLVSPQKAERAQEPAMMTAQDAAQRISPAPPALEAARPSPQPGPQPLAEDAPDPARTASILSVAPTQGALRPSVEVAETEEEIAALEALQRQEAEEDAGMMPEPQPAALAAPAEPTRVATASNYVNLRAGPSDDAEVLMVVPANAQIRAEDDCDWCAVAYDGRSGYIYRTFITYE